MNKKLKIIFDYTFLFIESILLFLLTLLLVLNFTILKSDYVIKKMNKSNYYSILEESIKTEMLYYTGQSGFNDDILDGTFTTDEIKEESISYVKNLYNGKKTVIDTSKFEERLNKKIDDYLEVKNFEIINKEEINKFTTEMAKIYSKRIKIIDKLDNLAVKFNKIIDMSNKALIILTISLFIVFMIHMILLKKIKIGIVLYTTSLLIIVLNIYIRWRIDLYHLHIYNELLSNIIIDNIGSILKITILIAILYFVLATLINICKKKSH